MIKYININNLNKSLSSFNSKKPFPYAIVDNFFKKNIALKLSREFPKYNDKNLHEYNNYCEVKKSSNNWNLFPSLTYRIFSLLNSNIITKVLSKKLKINKIFSDYGLNGGGWHLMNTRGRLNPHLDYSLHPKILGQRKFNLIIFLSPDWKRSWGGETCFYEKNLRNKNIPGNLITKIYPKFNRAIIFDTSKNSWHAVSSIKTYKIRKSIAVYYLVNPKKKVNKRKKALYAPERNQISNKKVIKFIKMRADQNSFSNVYKTKKK
tara:strand:- start:3022 stop:3810 length:789 start_codon:yes stop_codon:yes gene_type:complete